MNLKLCKLFLYTLLLSRLKPVRTWNYNFLLQLVGPLSKVVQSQEIVWFLSQELTTQHSEHLDIFMRKLCESTGLTQFVWTNRTDVRLMRLESKRNFMGMIFTTGPADPILTMHDRVLLGRHFYFSIVVLAPSIEVKNLYVVEQICHLLYQRNFINTMVYFETTDGINNIFGHSTFPDFHLQNRTNVYEFFRVHYAKLLAGAQDVMGYTFETPLQQDMPRVFQYSDSRGNQLVQGTSYRILETFVDLVNGTMRKYAMPKDAYGGDVVNMKQVLDLVRNKKLGLGAHAYALFKIDDDLDKSYPIMVVKWCLMVPLRNSVSTFLYPVQPFDWIVWICMVLALVTLSIVDALWIIWLASVQGTQQYLFKRIRASTIENYCFIINIAAPHQLKAPNFLKFLVFATIFFYGFFISANYTSLLGSFLTVTLFRAQINTMDDIVSAQLPVMIIDYELDFLLSEGYELPAGFDKLVKPVDSATFFRHQTRLNTTYAYFVTDDKWHFLQEQQRHLKQRIFKFTDICFGSFHLAFPMMPDSPLWRDIEYFLFRIHSSGLLQFYENIALDHAVAAGYVKFITESNEFASAGLQHLWTIFVMLIIVYVLGCICFLGELIWWYYRHIYQKLIFIN